jgi:hypothetical protein
MLPGAGCIGRISTDQLRRPSARLAGHAGWQGWAIAAQLAVIAVLAAQLLPHGAAPGYRHLAVAPASTPTCWWLQTDARLQDVQRILQPTAPRSSAVPPSPALHAGRGRHRQAQLLSALRADPQWNWRNR